MNLDQFDLLTFQSVAFVQTDTGYYGCPLKTPHSACFGGCSRPACLGCGRARGAYVLRWGFLGRETWTPLDVLGDQSPGTPRGVASMGNSRSCGGGVPGLENLQQGLRILSNSSWRSRGNGKGIPRIPLHRESVQEEILSGRGSESELAQSAGGGQSTAEPW